MRGDGGTDGGVEWVLGQEIKATELGGIKAAVQDESDSQPCLGGRCT